ncbi:spore germination protein [Ectobacillus ponti]|uniref:Spore germination protein n=1 Tax=Ectobacillus ponti TaxID=2961894 RepID=A0AA42BP59_9BACI|nr:spore germination protein [Ectobacillus ponti]MCP8967224.1 spore germination protein [Ectobacillus ponti]
MPFVINVFNVITNGVAQNGNIDIGGTIQNSHTANSKNVGLNLSFGNISPTGSCIVNGYVDADISDQGQLANPSLPILNQF